MDKEKDVSEVLRELRKNNQCCFFQRLPGSNGDLIHEYGSLEAIRKAKIQLVECTTDADVIIFDGGASMSLEWLIGFDILKKSLRDNKGKLHIIFPSTFSFKKGEFRKIITNSNSEVILFARDEKSYQLIKR